MHQFVECEKGDFIKDVLSYLELVSILDADTHLLYQLIESILFFLKTHCGSRS